MGAHASTDDLVIESKIPYRTQRSRRSRETDQTPVEYVPHRTFRAYTEQQQRHNRQLVRLFRLLIFGLLLQLGLSVAQLYALVLALEHALF